MTEAEWLLCVDPDSMVRSLSVERHKRELRLFAVGCVRRVWHLLSSSSRAAVEACEQYLEGMIGEAELRRVVEVAEIEMVAASPGDQPPDQTELAAAAAILAAAVWLHSHGHIITTASAASRAATRDFTPYGDEASFGPARRAELAAQASLLRQLVSGPAV